MTTAETTSWWNRLTVGQKLAIVPGLFVVAILGILLYTVLMAQDQRQDSFLVDMASRQRMLVQRQLAQVLLVSQGLPGPKEGSGRFDKDELLDAMQNTNYLATRQLLDETVEGLRDGKPVFELSSGLERDVDEPPTAELRNKLVEQKSALKAFADAADEFLKVKEGDPGYEPALKDLMSKAYLANLPTVAVTKAYSQNSQDKIAALILWESILSLAVIVGAVVCGWLVTRSIVTPLGSAVTLAQEIGRGNLAAAKLTEGGRDELGQLATAFNQMLESLRGLTSRTAAVTNNLNAASAEILASTQQQAAGTKEQAATIQEITTTMEEVRQSGQQISERARQVATSAEAASATTAAGLQAVQETNRIMAAVRAQVEDVAEKIVALSEKTQAVGEIIATVNDVAERSNLLALNAAIEAAGAGEQGNRFSVVAGEIKNLADQAKESTVQVRNILGDIQKGINSSVMLTEEAVKRADSGKQQADVAEQTIRRMADTTQDSVQAFQQIIGATSQQQIGFEQVVQGMQDIRQAATQTAASVVQLEKAAASLNGQSNQLRDAVGRYQL